jgi:2-iminobutanoate/2-iminopropanoate deaminase
MATKRQIIRTKPALDLGKVLNIPLSPAVRAGDFIFCTGYVSLNMETGKPELGSVASETRRILEILKAILESAGSSLDKVVKVNVFLTDFSGYDDYNRVYREFFPQDPPARRTVQAQLVDGFKVEIDCIALA